MAKKDIIEAKTEELLTPIALQNGLYVYDVEYVKEGQDYYLRCYIDKEEGVTIDDCEKVSRLMSELLDKDDYIEEAYIFEVSSPGLGRSLKKDRHFERSIGQEVLLKTYKPVEDAKEFTGLLKSFDDNSVTLCFDEDLEQGECMIFERKNIALIRLTIDF